MGKEKETIKSPSPTPSPSQSPDPKVEGAEIRDIFTLVETEAGEQELGDAALRLPDRVVIPDKKHEPVPSRGCAVEFEDIRRVFLSAKSLDDIYAVVANMPVTQYLDYLVKLFPKMDAPADFRTLVVNINKMSVGEIDSELAKVDRQLRLITGGKE